MCVGGEKKGSDDGASMFYHRKLTSRFTQQQKCMTFSPIFVFIFCSHLAILEDANAVMSLSL